MTQTMIGHGRFRFGHFDLGFKIYLGFRIWCFGFPLRESESYLSVAPQSLRTPIDSSRLANSCWSAVWMVNTCSGVLTAG